MKPGPSAMRFTTGLAQGWIMLAILLLSLPPTRADHGGDTSAVSTVKKPMDAAIRMALFDLVVELGKNRPFRTASLAQRIGVNFKRKHSTNPYYNFYQSHGTAKAPFSGIVVGVELKEPVDAPAEGSADGLLSIDINEKVCLRQEEVPKQFGALFEVEVPSPHGPSTLPIYWTYTRDGHQLSFGFSRREPACLVNVTLAPSEKR